MEVKVKILSEKGRVPTRAHDTDAGWDLYSSEDLQIMPDHRRLVSTSISLAIPEGHVGLVWPRSGLSVRKGIDVFAGVIDSGYRVEVKVCLFNSGATIFDINKGDRIAQILIQKISDCKMVGVESLDGSDRGDGGFGSSGN